MTISKDLFLALLSMDAYNRGYGEGISGLSAKAGTLLGSAKIIADANDKEGVAKAAGFYAVAYETTKDIGITETGGVIPEGTTLIAA